MLSMCKTYIASLISNTIFHKRWVADTLAMVVYSTIVAGINEYFIVGLGLSQVIVARIFATPINILTARPYGIYRDFVFQKFSINSKKWVNDLVVDTFSFVSFQTPLYIIILRFSGASFWEIFTGCFSALALLLLVGRLYGLWLDLVRKLFKI